jgi:hypothetical protein
VRFKAQPYLAESNRRRAVAPVHGVAAALVIVALSAAPPLTRAFVSPTPTSKRYRRQQQKTKVPIITIVAYRTNWLSGQRRSQASLVARLLQLRHQSTNLKNQTWKRRRDTPSTITSLHEQPMARPLIAISLAQSKGISYRFTMRRI